MKTNENFQLSTFNFQPDKRLAVVILNWNGRALMEEFLPSVVACTVHQVLSYTTFFKQAETSFPYITSQSLPADFY